MRIFSLFLLFGTLLIQGLDVLPTWQLGIIPLILFLLLAIALKQKSTFIYSLSLAAIALCLGFTLANYQATQILNNRITADFEGKELVVTGKIINIPSIRDDGVRFLFDVYSAKPASDTPLNKSVPLKGIIRLGLYKSIESIQSGELWQLKVKLKRPSGFMNPGGFDYEKWLFSQRIIATGYVREAKKGDAFQNQKLQQTLVFKSPDYWRQHIHTFIQDKVENQPSAAVLSALTVAVRDKLDDRQWQLLQATGTSHLIAIL